MYICVVCVCVYKQHIYRTASCFSGNRSSICKLWYKQTSR